MNFIDDRRLLYFLIAVFTTYSAAVMPANPWEWSKLIAGCLCSGMVALKSYQSAPAPAETDKPVVPPPTPLA